MMSPSTGLKNIVFSSYEYFTSMVDQLGEVLKGFPLESRTWCGTPYGFAGQLTFRMIKTFIKTFIFLYSFKISLIAVVVVIFFLS